MIVSSENVKKFLLDVINQTNFPGAMTEFVSAVKLEVARAETEKARPQIGCTASELMECEKAA